MNKWRVVQLVDANIKTDYGFIEAKDPVDAKRIVADMQPDMSRISRAYFISQLEAIPPKPAPPPAPPPIPRAPAQKVIVEVKPRVHLKENFTPNPNGAYARMRDAIDKSLKRRGKNVWLSFPEGTNANTIKSIFNTVCKIKRFRGMDLYMTHFLDQKEDPGIRIFRD